MELEDLNKEVKEIAFKHGARIVRKVLNEWKAANTSALPVESRAKFLENLREALKAEDTETGA